MCCLSVRLLILWMLVTSVCCINCPDDQFFWEWWCNCPDVVEQTLAPGQTCSSKVGNLIGESTCYGQWCSDTMQPRIDCFPEGTHSITLDRRCPYCGMNCSVEIFIKGVCSWNPNHCWPGDCSNNTASNCQCRSGFHMTGDETTGRRCKWNTKPDLTTCRVAMTDSQGQNTNSTNTGTDTDCSSQQDAGIRTQPAELYFVIKADFNLPFGSLVSYVSETKIGIVGAVVKVVKLSLDGSESTVLEQELKGPPFCQQSVSATNPVIGGNLYDCEATLSLPQDKVNLKDGESVCVDMKGIAGGYYKLQDYNGNYKSTETFPVTYSSKRVCFIFDETKPAHCRYTGGHCNTEPLTLSSRLTRSRLVEVNVSGWTDPRSSGGDWRSASGLDKFRLEVHGVDVGNDSLSVQENAITELTQSWNATSPSNGGPYSMSVTLPEKDRALLYAVILEVHDKAGNVAYARRLVLMGNSSSVQLWPSSTLTVVHANPDSNRRWQTDVSKELCVNWTGRFYNTDMYNNNFLMKVNTDSGREIYGHYDQISGILPVNGTDNVIGITKFEISWSLDQAPRSAFTEVSDLFAQTTCLQQPFTDGDTYDVWVRATDIMANTKEDSVRVSIDSTGPQVSTQGLQGRWNREGLYVHNTDLSTMTLVVTAADPHSGLSSIRWTLSTDAMITDLGHRSVGVQRLDNTTSCNGQDHCYCPSVGDCEIDRYLVTFTNLVDLNTHQGDHDRKYYITLAVINVASLISITSVEILLDESAPAVGVVWEGLAEDGLAEMDFTSSQVVHVRWHGYQDLESGIMLYRVLMAERCMTAVEMDEAVNVTEVVHETMASFTFPKEGRYFFSVVAYNGALEPSEVACSDGIIYDTTPPTLHNVSITHARGRQMIGCTQQNQAWLVHQNLTKVALHNTSHCLDIRSGQSPGLNVEHLPVSSSHILEPEISEHFCRALPRMSEDSVAVLPSDYVEINWKGFDSESQIEDYYIGIGGDPSASTALDLLPFTATHGHTSYHARHVGLGHGDMFFVFVRIVNKAGLSTTLTVGPILIDVTPPEVTQPLTAVVKEGLLLVTWQKDVFSDPEQPTNMDFDISFRIGHEDGFVTPWLPLSKHSVIQCQNDNFTVCVHYPVKVLHAYDTEHGRSFFFQLHVTNAAGHVTTVNTSSVRLPNHSAPSHAVILDVLKIPDYEIAPSAEPSLIESVIFESTPLHQGSKDHSLDVSLSMSTTPVLPVVSTENWKILSFKDRFSDDVDAFLRQDEMCVAWKGFYHKEEIKIDVGVGTKTDHDNILKFHSANGQNPVCLSLTSLPAYIKMFSVVRARSSGGTSVFSSDGFVIIPKINSENHITVFNGNACHENNVTGMGGNGQSGVTFNMSEIARMPIHAGDFLFIHLSPFVPHVVFQNAILLQTTLTGYQIIAETSDITIVFPHFMITNISLQIQHCQKDSTVLHLPNNQFTFTWEMTGPSTPFVKYFKTEIIDTTCLETSVKKEKYLHQKCTLHEEKTSAISRQVTVSHVDFHNNLLQDHTYVSSVSPCFDDGCLPAVTSRPVIYSASYAICAHFHQGTILDMSMQQLTVEVQVSVEPDLGAVNFNNQTCVYMWTVSSDRTGSIPLADWLVQKSSSCSSIQIREQITFRGNGQGTLYVCLRLLLPVKTQYPDCFKLLRSSISNVHEPFHVIELSHSTYRQIDFQPFIYSQQLGNKLHDLYDLDLDFASSDVMLSAILTNSHNLNVMWFLMTNHHVPDSRDCAGDVNCVMSKVGQGHVLFPRHPSKLQTGNIYYICATLAEESLTAAGTLQPVCGDGVVIDDTPPVKGSVAIGDADTGYLASGGHVIVSWFGFADVETDVPILHDSVTLNYSVALGSYPGAEDLASFVQVGQRTTWTFEPLTLASGVTCIATVKAQDRVGHVTEAWSSQVVIDNTPPVVAYVAAGTITAEEFLPGQELPVHWEGVEDMESGVLSIEVGVGQAGGGDNMIDFQTYQGTSATVTDTSGLLDGHAYVVLIKVTNWAGLTTIQSSAPFVVDSSPPSQGRLWYSGSNTTGQIIGGYSTQVGVYSVKWAGFTDVHSGLDYFRVGLGSRSGLTDIVPFVYVGRQTSYTWKRDFDQGEKYFATIQACNRAGLCCETSSHSLIFDDSPPTSGHVTVGLYGHHDKFLGHNTSVPAQWTGFSDPQTGIQHFTWCVGHKPGTCDVTPSTHTLLSRAAHKAGLALPLTTPLYVSVTAVNPAGLATVSVSDSFLVDPTPPEVVVKPHFLSPRDGNPANSQWDRSVLHVTWLFRDPESSVISHTVSIRSQLTGRLVLDPIILGPESQLTLPLGQTSLLTDGDLHWVSVSACNAAHLCVMATSDVILIDSTPPVTGTFLSPLTWTTDVTGDIRTIIDLKWRGFSDAESDVIGYEVMAGRHYNGEELSGGRVRVDHNSTTQTQHYRLEVREQLQAREIVHLAVLAKNRLHLPSPLVRMAFYCIHDNANGTSGFLELIRHSCEASYCTGECTCAAIGKMCKGSSSPCTELDPTDPAVASLQVLPYMGTPQELQSWNSSVYTPVMKPQIYMISAKCLEGHWSLSQPQSLLNVLRFEFSFSLTNMSAGEGVIDTQTDPIWYDVGHAMRAVHCLLGNRTLLSGQSYVLHVRVWPTRDSHMTFVSSPVVVDLSAPQIRRGRAILDSDSVCSKDIDYVTAEVSEVTACWKGMFHDSQSGVVSYQIWMGTSPKASNHHAVTDVGLNTTWTFPTMDLEPGTRYYITVRAWNAAGMQWTAVSDGFLVDVTSPFTGVVFPSGFYRNRHAQSSVSTISASWHGFEDSQSGVRSYHVGVFDDGNDLVPVMPFLNVGMKTELHRPDLTLTHGHSYKIAVKAVDAAGLESQPVESAAITVDVTPPEGVTCTEFLLMKNTTLIPTFTQFHLQDRYLADVTVHITDSGEVMEVKVTATGVDSSVLGYLQVAELRMPLSFVLFSSGEYTAHHSFLSPYSGDVHLQMVVEGPAEATVMGQLSQCLHTVPSSQHAVTLQQSSTHSVAICSRVRDQESGLQTLMVGVGTTPGGLQLLPWTRVSYSGHVTMNVHMQHATTLYATVISQNHAGQWSRFISAPLHFDKTGPAMSDVMLTLIYESESQDKVTEVWAEGRWLVKDAESGVDLCTCRSDGPNTIQSILLPAGDGMKGDCKWRLRHAWHGSKVTMSVTCYNTVQLYTTMRSQPTTVLLHPPAMTEVTLASISNNVFMSPYELTSPQVRSRNSGLQFFWRGVQDPTVTQFYFRFLLNSLPLTEWSPLQMYKTTAVLERMDGRMRSGDVTAQLMALNDRNMTSEVVSMIVEVEDTIPLLTGKTATLSFSKGELSLDWRHVFDVTGDVTYSVFVGTEEGYGDVFNHVTTKLTHFNGYYSGTLTRMYLSIQAVYDNGLFNIYVDDFDI